MLTNPTEPTDLDLALTEWFAVAQVNTRNEDQWCAVQATVLFLREQLMRAVLNNPTLTRDDVAAVLSDAIDTVTRYLDLDAPETR